MTVDYKYRRQQLMVITDAIARAIVMTRRYHGGDNNHIAAHYFEQFLSGRSIPGYLADIDLVLIPNLEKSEAWKVLIPEILKTVYPLRTMDATPKYGCPLCGW